MEELKTEILQCVADLGSATADQIVQHLDQSNIGNPAKLMIADIHRLLTKFYEDGVLKGDIKDGELYYRLA